MFKEQQHFLNSVILVMEGTQRLMMLKRRFTKSTAK